MGRGDYASASESVVNASKLKSELTSCEKKSNLIPILIQRFQGIQQGIQTSLEYIFDQAFSLTINEQENEKYKISFKNVIGKSVFYEFIMIKKLDLVFLLLI